MIKEGKDVTYDMKPHRDDPTAVGTRRWPRPSSGRWGPERVWPNRRATATSEQGHRGRRSVTRRAVAGCAPPRALIPGAASVARVGPEWTAVSSRSGPRRKIRMDSPNLAAVAWSTRCSHQDDAAIPHENRTIEASGQADRLRFTARLLGAHRVDR